MNHIIAVVGAHTAVGRNVVTALSDVGIPAKNVVALSYSDYIGKHISYDTNENLVCKSVDDYDFHGTSIVIFASGEGIAERYLGDAVRGGCAVIDSTSYSRKENAVPLIMPSLNGHKVGEYKKSGIISTPSSVASQASTVLFPLHERVPIERVVMSALYSVSHAGREAMSELYNQTKSMFMNQKVKQGEFSKQISFNCIPFVGEMVDDDYTTEERGIAEEINKVLEGVAVSVTCVYIPVYVSHSLILNIQFRKHISKDEVLEILDDTPNVLVVGGENETKYVTPIECVNDEEVYVSRVRNDLTVPHGISLWCAADNLRRSALDIVRVAQILMEEHLS